MRASKFGQFVTALRNAAGLSIAELSRRSGVPHQTLSRIEAGSGFNFDTAVRIADALGVSVEKLRGE